MRTIRVLGMLLVCFAAIGLAAAQNPARNYVTHLDGEEEVPVRDTQAQGQAIFQLIVANIENVVASHIHLAVAGVNGPVVAFLFGAVAPAGGRSDGVLATGTLTAANLVGPLAGMPLAVLTAAMDANGTYANVHTNDGVEPTNTGPGDFPGGEIRGQIRPAGR